MASKNNVVTVTPTEYAVDIDALGIRVPSQVVDLENLTQPLRKIEDFLGEPVILSNPETKISTVNNNNKGSELSQYYIFTVQSIVTGETWRSSCGHWFMNAYIDECKANNTKPFPIAVRFHRDTNDPRAIRFVDARSPIPGDNGDIPF